MSARILLASTGRAEALAAARALANAEGAELVTLSLDIGQGLDLASVRDRAQASGAVRAHVLDARDAFAQEFVRPALLAGALEDGGAVLDALVLPIVVQRLLQIAAIERATAVAHGGVDDDARRMAAEARALGAPIRVIALGRAAAGGARQVSGTSQPSTTPWRLHRVEEPANVELGFERGVPASINGVSMPLRELLESLSVIAARHGVRARREQEGALTGTRVRHVCGGAAASVLQAAHSALEASVLPGDLLRQMRQASAEYAAAVSGGPWFTPRRLALDEWIDGVQVRVTGTARVRVFDGAINASVAPASGPVLAE